MHDTSRAGFYFASACGVGDLHVISGPTGASCLFMMAGEEKEKKEEEGKEIHSIKTPLKYVYDSLPRSSKA